MWIIRYWTINKVVLMYHLVNTSLPLFLDLAMLFLIKVLQSIPDLVGFLELGARPSLG